MDRTEIDQEIARVAGNLAAIDADLAGDRIVGANGKPIEKPKPETLEIPAPLPIYAPEDFKLGLCQDGTRIFVGFEVKDRGRFGLVLTKKLAKKVQRELGEHIRKVNSVA